MSTNTQPTEQEIALALDVISRSAKARQAGGKIDTELQAIRRQRGKNQALATECDNLQSTIYLHLLDALPDDLKKLFQLYGLMVVAPYVVNKKSFKVFQSCTRNAKKLLAQRRV